MITTSQAHIDLLNSRAFASVDLFEFTFIDGSTIRYAGGGLSITWEGKTFQGGEPLIKRDSVRIGRGLEADNMTLTVTPHEDDLLVGLPFVAAVHNGVFDGALFTLWRGHYAKPGSPIVGAIQRFSGPVTDVEGEDDIRITVKSWLSQLDRQIPVEVYQPGCNWTIFSAGCGLSRTAYQVSGALQAGSTQSVLAVALTQASGYFDGGEIRFVSGANAGARRTVKIHSGGELLLAYPLPMPVTAGDAYVIWPGCDGTHARCGAFGNQPRFRGQPDIPAPETAY